eukprot:5852587-Amphidinium_carterae.1
MKRTGSSKPNLTRSGSKPNLTRSHTGTLTLPSLASPQIYSSERPVVKVDEESESDGENHEAFLSPPTAQLPAPTSGIVVASPD